MNQDSCYSIYSHFFQTLPCRQILDRPGRTLGDLGDVEDVRELSPRFSNSEFSCWPYSICISQKLRDYEDLYKKSLNCLLHTAKKHLFH